MYKIEKDIHEVSGHALDWLVDLCEGIIRPDDGRYAGHESLDHWSTNPHKGHEILEREGISLKCNNVAPSYAKWTAIANDGKTLANGPTALIAAMRCRVASKLGPVVKVPAAFF